ncbi:MAG: PHA/PHB synthase family protein [Alphaproteobacteria bacterium]
MAKISTEENFKNYFSSLFSTYSLQMIEFLFKNQPLDSEEKNRLIFLSDFFNNMWKSAVVPTINDDFPDIFTQKIDLKQNILNIKKDFLNFYLDSYIDKTKYKLGENLANTPGIVIFENELFQLIYYLPITEVVYETPILIIPPWINKYYIFDLTKDLSFVKWNIMQKRSVFIISWVNPDSSYRDIAFEDYIFKGIGKAVNVIQKYLSTPKVNALGFCISGNALACFLAHDAKKKYPTIRSATFLATPFDFKYLKQLKLFLNNQGINVVNKFFSKKGVLNGELLAFFFRSLRNKEFFWPNFFDYYFFNKKPKTSELLYWNGDVTHLPLNMHIQYIKNFFLKNIFIESQKSCIDNNCNFKNVEIPIFMLATKNDHIIPWKSVFKGVHLFRKVFFVLGEAGHVVGVIHSPEKNKYSHWVVKNNSSNSLLQCLKMAKKEPFSWWKTWSKWMNVCDGRLIDSSICTCSYIEKAPGRYAFDTLPKI